MIPKWQRPLEALSSTFQDNPKSKSSPKKQWKPPNKTTSSQPFDRFYQKQRNNLLPPRFQPSPNKNPSFKDLSSEDKARLATLVRQLAYAETEKAKLSEALQELQRAHEELTESLARKQQERQHEERQQGIRERTQQKQEQLLPSYQPAAKNTPQRGMDGEDETFEETNNLEIGEEAQGSATGPVLSSNIQKQVQDLQKHRKTSTSLLKRYHKRITQLQHDRDGLMVQIQQLQQAVSQSEMGSRIGLRGDESGRLSQGRLLYDIQSSPRQRTFSDTPSEKASPGKTGSTPNSVLGSDPHQFLTIKDEDINRIVDQLASRLQSPTSGSPVKSAPLVQLEDRTPVSTNDSLTSGQRDTIRKLLQKSKLEAMETASIAFTNLPGEVGRDSNDDGEDEVENIPIGQTFSAPPSSTFIRDYLQQKMRSASQSNENKSSNVQHEHSHVYRPLPKISSRDGFRESVRSSRDSKSSAIVQKPAVEEGVFLFRDDTSMSTSLADILDDMEKAETSDILLGDAHPSGMILGTSEDAELLDEVISNLNSQI